MTRRCLCACHEIVGEPHRADGVDVRDEVEAFKACAACQNAHCAALSDAPETPAGIVTTGDYLPPTPWIGDGEDGG